MWGFCLKYCKNQNKGCTFVSTNKEKDMETQRFKVKKVVKFGMIFGYVVYDNLKKENTAYEYSESEKYLADSKAERLNLLIHSNIHI